MKLLIPGPVTTAPAVREAAACDYAPWDPDFRALAAKVHARLLALAGGRPDEHAVIPLQASGHFIIEAAIRTFIPRGGRLLVPMTGQYAERLARLAEAAGRIVTRMPLAPDCRLDAAQVTAALAADPGLTHVACVYSETSSGIVHDAPSIAAAAGCLGRRVLIDAVSAFGALPLDVGALPAIDAVLFTGNKCLEGLPGTAYAVARVDRLAAVPPGRAESWSLDLADAYACAVNEGSGTYRFTPAAQAVAALDRALDLHAAEGGIAARRARYAANARALLAGVRRVGLAPCLDPALQGPIVVNVRAPRDPAWDLQRFVAALKRRGYLISNFICIPQPSFRVGCIGALTPGDLTDAAAAMGEALEEIGVRALEAA